MGPSKVVTQTPDKKTFKLKVFKHEFNLSSFHMAAVLCLVVVGLIGTFTLLHSFAASVVVATSEAEKMSLPRNASIVQDTSASGGQAIVFGKVGSATSTINLPSDATSLAVTAYGKSCHGAAPTMSLQVDGTTILPNTSVTSSGWADYSVATSLKSGNHTLLLNYSAGCRLYADKITFYGTVAPQPTPAITLSASPNSITSGSATTLTWNSTNSSSCSASGGWSGSRPTSGSTSTGALNSGATYSLSCTGSGGSASASTTISVSAQVTNYQPPIVITSGGTYTGNWESLDPTKPAVTINTSAPVIIQNSRIRGMGNLIRLPAGYSGANVTVRNSYGFGLNPNVAGKAPGRFFVAESPANIDIEGNYIQGTSGIYILGYSGDHSAWQTYKILRNRVKDVDGRYSDGTGGFSLTGYAVTQFVQFDKVRGLNNAEIGWNEVVNEPGKSRTEDVISMYLSSGLSTSPISIHDNYIQGSYPSQPATDGFSGGGIMLGDGAATVASDAASYIRATSNQVISTTNYGIAIASGHDIQFSNNRIISSGFLSDGTFIAAQNIGFYIWNSSSSPVWGNNFETNNTIGWIQTASGTRNDNWYPDCAKDAAGASLCTGNIHLANPITLQTEAGELGIWQNKLTSSSVSLGPNFAL